MSRGRKRRLLPDNRSHAGGLAGVAAPTPMSHARRAGEMGERMFAGEAGPVMMAEIRGASNAKAKRERQGFAT
jgi:hypothetical protein